MLDNYEKQSMFLEPYLKYNISQSMNYILLQAQV